MVAMVPHINCSWDTMARCICWMPWPMPLIERRMSGSGGRRAGRDHLFGINDLIGDKPIESQPVEPCRGARIIKLTELLAYQINVSTNVYVT
jgi:hypothetical protein